MEKPKIILLGLTIITVLGFLFLSITVVLADETVTVTVDCWNIGHCLDKSYDCGGSTTCSACYDSNGVAQCYKGLDNGSTCAFIDPVPAGRRIIKIDAHVAGDNGRPDCPVGTANISINNNPIGSGGFTSTGSCDFSGFNIVNNNPNLAGYNYGGINNLNLTITGGHSCVSQVDLTFHLGCTTDADCPA